MKRQNLPPTKQNSTLTVRWFVILSLKVSFLPPLDFSFAFLLQWMFITRVLQASIVSEYTSQCRIEFWIQAYSTASWRVRVALHCKIYSSLRVLTLCIQYTIDHLSKFRFIAINTDMFEMFVCNNPINQSDQDSPLHDILHQ